MVHWTVVWYRARISPGVLLKRNPTASTMAVVSIGTRGRKGKAEQEEGLFQQYILRRIARVCRLIDSSCLPDIQAKPTPYCCTYRSAPSSSRVFSESRIDGRTAYRRETRALLGIVEIFHRIGRRTPCTVARFIYTFSLCTWSFWMLQNAAVISLNYYFNVKFLFLRFSWSLFLIFNFHMEENNNCYIIEIRNRKQNFHVYFLKLKKKRKYSLEIFPHTESEIHPRKPNSKLFETEYKSSFLYSYRKIAIVHLSCFPPPLDRLVWLLLTSLIGALNSKERGIDLYERLERSLIRPYRNGTPCRMEHRRRTARFAVTERVWWRVVTVWEHHPSDFDIKALLI